MRIDRRIIAGTALGLLMAAGSGASAATSTHEQAAAPRAAEAPMLLAQADLDALKQKLQDPGLTKKQRQQIERQIEALRGGGQGAEPGKPAEPAEEAPARAEEQKPAQAEEQTPAQAGERKPARNGAAREDGQRPADRNPARAGGAKPAPADEQKPAQAGEQKPADRPAAPADAQKPAQAEGAKPAPVDEQKPAQAEEQKPAPAEEQKPAQAEEQKPAQAEGAKPAPAEEQKPAQAGERKPAGEGAGRSAGQRPADQGAPRRDQRPEQAGRHRPDDRQRPPEDQRGPADKGAAGKPGPSDDANVLPENAAPVLDSQKEAEQPGGKAPAAGQEPGRQQGQGQQNAAPAAPAGPPPRTDADAQKRTKPVKVESLKATRGKPVDAAKARERMQDRDGASVLKEIGDRMLIQLGNRTIVESNDRPRLTRHARDVRYEDLPGGWSREVIMRPDGSSVITIRDRFGDIIRRSRVTADGREYVMVYASDRDHGPGSGPDRGHGGWRDPGRDLPPLRLTIPVNQYILDAGRVEDPRRYYDFLEEPPVEPVQRLYSLDEVKYSARVRDTMRRIDLDVINFDTGSASVGEGEARKLDSIADAMERIIRKNPAETFLIEGHTDAVGSDQSNLVLSDRRAEAVAATLTDVFGIPPENLVTQGYGERYLKVETQDASRANRRVAIRRITPLVAPVASAN